MMGCRTLLNYYLTPSAIAHSIRIGNLYGPLDSSNRAAVTLQVLYGHE
jgi:hypothetical protein